MSETDLSNTDDGEDLADDALAVDPILGPTAAISATIQPAVNVALWQNHVPVLTELTVMATAMEPAGDITIDLTCEPSVIGPRSWHLQGVVNGQVRGLDDLDLTLDGTMLAALTEGTRAVATFTARRSGAGGETLAELRRDIRVLAHNEWGGSAGIPDILAAFVEPNDPAVGKLLHLTSDHLRMAGKPDGLEGYQATNKSRIWEQVEALWRAIGSLDIRYINPPPSFERIGQRIRPPHQILAEKLATCLDLAVLFAACIEAIGLRPVIVVIRDHAFAGFWLTQHDFGSSVADDAPGLRTRLALHDLLLFETTLVCGRGKSGFKRACEAGEAHVRPDKDDAFEAVIDVHRARQRRDSSPELSRRRLRPAGGRFRRMTLMWWFSLSRNPRHSGKTLRLTRRLRLQRRTADWSAGKSGCWISPAATVFLICKPAASRHLLSIVQTRHSSKISSRLCGGGQKRSH